MRRLSLLVAVFTTLHLAACGNVEPPTSATTAAGAMTSMPAAVADNHLSMRIDGVEWQADHDVYGAFHPAGYERALLIAGGKGRKDASEQTLNINLFGIDGPGRYRIAIGDAAGSVAQLANHTPERFLAGSMMGYDLMVEVRVAQAEPTRIDATFSGSLTGNDGVVLKLSDGRFSYRE